MHITQFVSPKIKVASRCYFLRKFSRDESIIKGGLPPQLYSFSLKPCRYLNTVIQPSQMTAMQPNTAPATSIATQYAAAYEWQPTTSPGTLMMPTSNCPPTAEHQAQFVDAPDSTGYICEVAQSMIE
jgi:hypothetical protein